MKRIDLIAGARPNFMKIAPIIDALNAAESRGGSLRFRLIHTGQHYDRAMSGSFFEELGIPDPDINLEVGSGTQAEQTAAIMVNYEKVLLKQKSDLCLVVGDVTSTMACSIAARKLGVPVAHVEGGIRSGDWTMPEEINRVVTDSITNWFFTTSETANDNLRRAGVTDDRIFFVGNTMIDTLLKQMPRLRPPACWDSLKLQTGPLFRRHPASPGECRWRATVTATAACHRRRHARPAGGVSGASAHRQEPARPRQQDAATELCRSARLPGIQLPGEACQGRDYRFRRHHRPHPRRASLQYDTPRTAVEL